jgi:hypothetical protein
MKTFLLNRDRFFQLKEESLRTLDVINEYLIMIVNFIKVLEVCDEIMINNY